MFWRWFKKSTAKSPPLLPVEPPTRGWNSVHDFTHPDWPTLAAQMPDAPADTIYWTLTKFWLDRLCRDAGPKFGHSSSLHFRLLAPYPERIRRLHLRVLESLRERLVRWLGEAAWTSGEGPHVVLVLDSPDAYWRYVAPFRQEGTSGASSGVCIRGDYIHVATYDRGFADALHSMFGHELVHVLLSQQTIPLWLEEGLAQLLGEPGRPLDTSELQSVWRAHGLASFWNGRAFSAADERQKAAYELGRAMVGRILEHRALPQFIRHSQRYDGGAAAARKHLGFELADLVTHILGPGNWAPAAVHFKGWPGSRD